MTGLQLAETVFEVISLEAMNANSHMKQTNRAFIAVYMFNGVQDEEIYDAISDCVFNWIVCST